MRKLLVAILLLLVAAGGWFFLWRSMMADDVAQVEATIKHHYDTIKATTPSATLKADAVYATGFPFQFRVAVHRPTLTQVWGSESYAVSFEKIELSRVNASRFKVIAPATFDAMYAIVGGAPEQYRVTLNESPQLWLEGKAGEALTQYGVVLPKKLVLDVGFNNQTKQIGFDFPVQLPAPVFAPIPADVSNPLQIFIAMLREAMIFQGVQ